MIEVKISWHDHRQHTRGKTRLSELVKAVEERNETVVLCRDGREVAEIRRRVKRRAIRNRGEEILDRVGLSHRLKHKPSELSGGEMQRAAIARALIGKPQVLLADEPTGNLDTATGQEIMGLLRDLNRREGLTIVMVTHNLELVHDTDRVVRLAGGQIEPEEKISPPHFATVGGAK